MTAQLLASELSTLMQEAKRKNPELRNAAEKSLADLKALPRTSELQIAADLKVRPGFVRPFVVACATRNAKFATSAVVCLLRLIVAQALAKETLPDVLEALRECSTLALDIQLKVLQAVPSLLQNYASSLTGQLLTATYQVAFLLYGSKIPVVSNTAAAALQQLVNSTFEKAGSNEDHEEDDEKKEEVSIEDGKISIWGSALDAHQLLEDICLMTEGQKAKNYQGAFLVQNFGLELLESILANHADVVASHPNLINILRLRLLPLLIKLLSEKASFSSTVRTMRLLQLILSRLLFALASESEMALSLLNHILDPDAAALWKRVLCLEVFRSLHSEPALIRSMYAHYDEDEGNRNIIRDHLGCLVRLASEKPAVIGLGQQSSVPMIQADDSGDQAAMQAGGFIGTIGASVQTVDIDTPGISNRWSIVRTPCIDMLDKNDPPPLPATYLYSLALACIISFSEGLARFLLPFTVPVEAKSKRRHTRTQERERTASPSDPELANQEISSHHIQSNHGRRIPTNPLSLKNHVLYDQISTSAYMVDHCWPALLAASSTFLNAAIDSENFHALIRSFQKFTQIAGLLDLRTPRDAFLTTLGKQAVPSITSSKNVRNVNSPTIPGTPADGTDQRSGDRESDGGLLRSPLKRQQTFEGPAPAMNTRHLLCLRALLNLGIALGPFLSRSWSIILETLQQADLVANISNVGQNTKTLSLRRKADLAAGLEDAEAAEDLALEITAAETAALRMFESTIELPSSSFLDLLQCICLLLRQATNDIALENSPNGMLSPGAVMKRHPKLRSVSGTSLETSAADRERVFALEKLQQIIRSNVPRLQQADSEESGWDLIFNELSALLSSVSAPPELRVKAAIVLNEMFFLTATSDAAEGSAQPDELRARSLEAIAHEIKSIEDKDANSSRSNLQCELDVQARALDATRAILEQCGDSLRSGWSSVFIIVNSIFEHQDHPNFTTKPRRPKSVNLVRSSFGSLQLICSDFLASVPFPSLSQLLDTLFAFSAQDQDLNISLTSATLFRNISDFLVRDLEQLEFENWQNEKAVDENSIHTDIDASATTRRSAMWLYLLSRLVQSSTDNRLEVRHGILRTLFGIMDERSRNVDGATIQVCFNHVILALLCANQEHYAVILSPSRESQNEAALWDQTAVILVSGICNVVAQWLETSIEVYDVKGMFERLLGRMEQYICRKSLAVSKAVFAGMTRILSEIGDPFLLGEESLQKSWAQWQENNPATYIYESREDSDNQNALLAYLECIGQLLRLFKDRATLDQIDITLAQLRIVVQGSSVSAYTSDVDQMTAVQRAVLDTLKKIPTFLPRAAIKVLDYIVAFVTIAYEQIDRAAKFPKTYLALSKASMSLLESFLAHHSQGPEVEVIQFLTKALHALDKPIHLKYRFYPEGKAPSPWRKATNVAADVLEKFQYLLDIDKSRNAANTELWEEIVHVVDGIIGGDGSEIGDVDVLQSDQESDLHAFNRIHAILVPGLGAVTIPNHIRQSYAECIFRHSLIHEPHPYDIARPGQVLLEGLRTNSIGRVQDLPPSPRSRLSYRLLDELFDLVALHDGSVERVNLSQAAASCLILRVGMSLKAYIYDQPLRGLMPQPWTQREEIFYLLQKLQHLKPEPRFMPAPSGYAPHPKAHLHHLFPFLMRSLSAARNDREMEVAFKHIIETTGTYATT